MHKESAPNTHGAVKTPTRDESPPAFEWRETRKAVRVGCVWVECVMMQPSRAAELLQLNTANRPMQPRHLCTIAAELSEGRFDKLNGETIVVGRDYKTGEERLLDGQYRLTSCVNTGVSFPTLVVYGVPIEVFDRIDMGRVRTAAEVLGIRGERETGRLTATLRHVDAVLRDRLRLRAGASNTEVEQILDRHPETRESVEFVRKMAGDSKLLMPFQILAGCHYLFRKADPKLADKVVEQFISGAGIPPDSPINEVRERLLQFQLKGEKPPHLYVAAIFIKAWNVLKTGKQFGKIQFKMHGSNPEEFPRIEGLPSTFYGSEPTN